jgi:hypothetical protein
VAESLVQSFQATRILCLSHSMEAAQIINLYFICGLIATKNVFAEDNCRILINEVLFSERFDFIEQVPFENDLRMGNFVELKLHCTEAVSTDISLNNYLLLFISIDKLELVHSLDLSGFRISNLFVIGSGDDVFNVNFDTDSLPDTLYDQYMCVVIKLNNP